jgi:hypothetical protein
MVCWFTPPAYLSISKRQGLLNFLDAFGKWSLVDTLPVLQKGAKIAPLQLRNAD